MTFLFILLILIILVFLFFQQKQFGRLPSGDYAARIHQSSNYKNGKFQNESPTADLTEGANLFKVMNEFIFHKSKRNKPAGILPSVKTLINIPPEDTLIWMGHSSYFMRIDGKNILVDPVLSGNASPVSFTTKSFAGSDIYTTDDIPEIDFLFISHDHWDHLDYKTVKALIPKVKKVITGIGVQPHLLRWGFSPDTIIERDWNEEINLENGFSVTTAPARHFSGRLFKRNQSIWSSFILKTPTMKIYLGGDSGFDSHFEKIGNKHGPFDFSILECGQYNKHWKFIHMMPEQVVMAAALLQSKNFMIVHWAKFSLSLHDWDEPISRVVNESRKQKLNLVHPMIGEAVSLKNPQTGTEWWKNVR
jgi:L-ascorbate metabolism protein UlaG (beta-lactamase superfamily)